MGFLKDLLSRKDAPAPSGMRRERLVLDDPAPPRLYAMGDIHGCITELLALERLIAEDAGEDASKACLIHLGDHVDRGPRSADVLEHLRSTGPGGMRRICLLGNHEDMMLDFLRDPGPDHAWLEFGGRETLASYGIGSWGRSRAELRNLLASHIPQEHVDFLGKMPIMVRALSYCFVHAGLRPGILPAHQSDSDLIWYRPPGAPNGETPPAAGFPTVVHGHVPVPEAQVVVGRINVDTGAYSTGRLSAVRLAEGVAPVFLHTGPKEA